MAFRNLMIENPAHLSVRSHQLVIRTDAERSVPIEDISAILLENRQSTVTTAALSQLGQRGCAVYLCDEKHMPCAVLEPFQQHSRMFSILQSQLDASEPTKKRLWQSIVQAKIRNQAICLQLSGMAEEAEKLSRMAERVRSGDPENIEATAAQAYFPALFGEGFTRAAENGYNAAVNYGYAILRGSVARSLAVYGFLPAFGLHHRSSLNAFNLADDLMEPFRPVVDRLAVSLMEREELLTSAQKRLLFNCLNLDILSGEQHHSVAYAIERLVQSLGRALTQKDSTLLLPTLLETEQHRYE